MPPDLTSRTGCCNGLRLVVGLSRPTCAMLTQNGHTARLCAIRVAQMDPSSPGSEPLRKLAIDADGRGTASNAPSVARESVPAISTKEDSRSAGSTMDMKQQDGSVSDLVERLADLEATLQSLFEPGRRMPKVGRYLAGREHSDLDQGPSDRITLPLP
jgi:hypothetical protein